MHLLRRTRGDDGAAAVEFALLFPIFMVLAMGTINGGLAYSRQINVTQSAREASRYGATYDISQINAGVGTLATRVATWLSAVDTAVQQSAGNAGNPIGGYDYRCVAIVSTDANGAVIQGKTWYEENGGSSTQATSNAGCPTTTAAAIKNTTYVQVAMSRNIQFFVIFANPTLHLDAVSTTPYEFALT